MWFHVVSDGAIGSVTQAQIDAQMTVLNLAFAGFYGGAKSGFRFELAGVTRTDNADWFYGGITGSGERPMKRALHRGGFETLNVYSTTAGPYLGWAYLPGLPDSNLYLDGIVFDWESMVGTSDTYAGRYDLGMTLVHEAGHWVNLEHTFYGGCNAKGDFVDDTPPMKVPTSGCPEGKDTCSEPGLDPIHNYMDYSYDSCYNQFTAGRSPARRTPGSTSGRSSGMIGREPAAGSRLPVPARYTLTPRARSSGDRAFASGAKGRTFESCRAHASPLCVP